MDVIINSMLYSFPDRKSFLRWLGEELQWMGNNHFFIVVREYA